MTISSPNPFSGGYRFRLYIYKRCRVISIRKGAPFNLHLDVAATAKNWRFSGIIRPIFAACFDSHHVLGP